jgi:hypothetical protein
LGGAPRPACIGPPSARQSRNPRATSISCAGRAIFSKPSSTRRHARTGPTRSGGIGPEASRSTAARSVPPRPVTWSMPAKPSRAANRSGLRNASTSEIRSFGAGTRQG